MAKKSFKNVASAFFSESQEDTAIANQQNKDTEDEKYIQDNENTANTPQVQNTYYRINLKLKGEYKEYLDQVSWENRTSITGYLNDLISKDMEIYIENKKNK